MNRNRAGTLSWLLPVLAFAAAAGPVQASIIFADSSIITGFDVHVDFDVNPLDPPNLFDEDAHIFDHYVSNGVRFRDTLHPFASPLGGSPGEIEDDEWYSFPNSLEVEDDEPAYILFQTPVLAAGAYVLADDDSDEIRLSAYDINLRLVGTVSVSGDEEAWRFLGFASSVPISVIAFGAGEEEFRVDDLGATIVPEPTCSVLVLTAGLAMLRRKRRETSFD